MTFVLPEDGVLRVQMRRCGRSKVPKHANGRDHNTKPKSKQLINTQQSTHKASFIYATSISPEDGVFHVQVRRGPQKEREAGLAAVGVIKSPHGHYACSAFKKCYIKDISS